MRELTAEEYWVQISDLHKGTCYWTNSADKCRDNTDREVYRLVLEHDDTISMGCIIGAPEHLVSKGFNRRP